MSSGARGMRTTGVPAGRLEVWRVGALDGVGRMSVCTPGVSTVLRADPQAVKATSRNGVLEYVVHRVEDAAVDGFVLREGRYVRQEADADGIHRSTVFPGLWLDVHALLRTDLGALCSCIERGIADPAHAAFAARFRPRQ